jgi:hypothetical protein
MNDALEKYTNSYLNFTNIKSSYELLKRSNDLMDEDSTDIDETSAINYRKSYYEQQAIETASYVYIICLAIYGLVAFGAIVTLLRNPNTGKLKLLFAVIAMILYPYFSVTISLWIMKIWKKFMDLLPTNVYRNL